MGLHGRGILPNSICLSIVHEVLKAFQGNINSVLVTECTFAGLLTVPKDVNDIKYKVSVNVGGAINFNIMETNIKQTRLLIANISDTIERKEVHNKNRHEQKRLF